MRAKITRAYIRTYSDTGQTKAYVEFSDKRSTGRTEGEAYQANVPCDCCGQRLRPNFTIGSEAFFLSPHMQAQFVRAQEHGVTIERETW